MVNFQRGWGVKSDGKRDDEGGGDECEVVIRLRKVHGFLAASVETAQWENNG